MKPWKKTNLPLASPIVERRLISLLRPAMRTVYEGDICIPAVWKRPDGKFYFGYRADTGTDVFLPDLTADDPFTVARLAREFTAEMCGVA